MSLHRLEGRINKRIDGVEECIGRFERQVDSIDARLRMVEQGQAEIKGSVNTLRQIVVATLQSQI